MGNDAGKTNCSEIKQTSQEVWELASKTRRLLFNRIQSATRRSKQRVGWATASQQAAKAVIDIDIYIYILYIYRKNCRKV